MATSVGTVYSKLLLLLLLEHYSLTQPAYIPSKGICPSTLTKLLDVKEETQKVECAKLCTWQEYVCH
jgi:hypothetical protein